MEWEQVRRSVSADEHPGIPDSCTVYECWDRGDRSLTIYTGDGVYWLSEIVGDHMDTVAGPIDDYDSAKDQLEQRKQQS